MIYPKLAAPSAVGDDLLLLPRGMSWRDHLISLLHAAAELEHGFMVQYLYAAYSIDTDVADPALARKVLKWRGDILTVAKEEMGHLLTVQNALCLLSGPVSVGRPNFPWDSPFTPYPFHLRPLSLESLSLFVHGERPDDRTLGALGKRLSGRNALESIGIHGPQIEKCIRPLLSEQPSRVRVGAIYDRIIETLEHPSRIPDSAFCAERYSSQASWDEWGRRYRPAPAEPGQRTPDKGESKSEIIIRRMSSRTDAIEALRHVAGQGEAAHIQSRMREEKSHFERFVEIYSQFADTPAPPVHFVPTNPNTDSSRHRDAGTITSRVSRIWADLFNCRYRILLTYLTHTFRLVRGGAGSTLRGDVLQKIFGEMYNLKAIAGVLARSPMHDDPDRRERAGAPFAMPYDLTLPLDDIDCWRMHRDILGRSQRLCTVLLAAGDALRPEGRVFLEALSELDEQADRWIRSILDGLGDTRGRR
ncbi:MAG: ferritin-like domain-containing protein [Vicinamibacterales bacterium]